MTSRRSAAVGLALVFAIAAAALWLRDHEGLTVDDPRHARDYRPGGELRHPAVVRYLSALPGHQDSACFGLVLEAPEGFPDRLLNLTAVEPRLGSTFDGFVAGGGFAAAGRWWRERGRQDFPDHLVERLPRHELPRRVLPPVDLTLAQLEAGERFVVGVGFNYAAHRQETDAEVDRFLFAKMVAPTGAYARLSLGPALIPAVGFAQLVDYEVEIAFVLLEDLRLDALPPPAVLARSLAYLHANDVSNRRPIIVRGDRGFTLAKSAPGYLPLGPWMVHGGELDLATAAGGFPRRGTNGKPEELVLSLRVEEPAGDPSRSHRQDASSREMLRGPHEVLRMFEEIRGRSARPDASGKLRGIALEDGDAAALLPKGSIVLTGTPHGTAIEAPTGLDSARLFLLGNLSRTGARLAFAAHCVRQRRTMGFLSPGDVVDAFITGLGRQRWEVQA